MAKEWTTLVRNIPLEEILPHLKTIFDPNYKEMYDKGGKEFTNFIHSEIRGYVVRTNTQLLQLLKLKKAGCVCCGLDCAGFDIRKNNNVKDPRKRIRLFPFVLDEYGYKIDLTRDHIVPASKGGISRIFNLQPLCVECNGYKGDSESFPVVKELVAIKRRERAKKKAD